MIEIRPVLYMNFRMSVWYSFSIAKAACAKDYHQYVKVEVEASTERFVLFSCINLLQSKTIAHCILAAKFGVT